MPVTALVVFGFSLFGITLLFAVKAREATHPSVSRARWREKADEFALEIKWVVLVIEWYVSRFPLIVALISRRLVHSGALSFAHLARVSAEYAHRLADFVSHKRSFERRETKSDFLKQVTDHKNGNGGNGNSSQV